MYGNLLLLPLLCSTAAALQMTGPSTYTASVGSIAHIPCTFTADKLPADLRFFAVLWYLEGKMILSYDDIITSTDPRYSLDKDRAVYGNADLTITNAFVSDGGDYTCSVTYSPLRMEKKVRVGITGSELEVTAPASHTALLFQSLVVLPCTFHMDTPVNQKYLSIIWYFRGRELLKMDDKKKSIRNGLSFDEWAARKGNASLTIHNVATANHGTYKCLVIYSSHQQYREIQLTVYARPVLSILNKSVRRNTNNALTCLAAGFFPSDIGITWYRDGEVLKNQAMGKLDNYKARTYQVKSSVIITPSDNNQSETFTCRVQHVSLSEVIQEDFQLVYEETSSTVPIVVGVVLMALIAIVICIFCWIQKRRRAATATFTLMDIEGPSKLIAGEEATLYCRATKCPENISVEWLEKRGGQACEILQSYGGDNEEKGRLLDTMYGIISSREGPHYTSSLTFRPSVAKHKDVTFICRYRCGKWKKEKTFHCRNICAKLQLLQPVSRSLIVSGELKYSVTLEKFYPRDITLRWAHGVGETQETIQSTETVTDIPDGTYSVCSEVRIPEELLKDPEFRVRVSWGHQSLDTPGYKDLSIRDSEYTWNPLVEEIQTPPLFHDTPVTLQCHISEYFPDAITVTWLRSENQELCEEDEYKVISTTTSRKEADNTYSCTASLTIDPKPSVHQGAAYICRVDHPSLETPIERRTGKLVVESEC